MQTSCPIDNIVIIIAGPTASGKSSLALDIAQELNGAVVNADSMQVYRNTPILSACPDEHDKSLVPHYLYEIYDNSHHGTVAEWSKVAVAKIKELWLEGKTPIVTGGSGMYIDILINGIKEIPKASDEAKAKSEAVLEKGGTQSLHQELEKVDKITADKLSPNDTSRIRRAYEVFLTTGKPLSEWNQLENTKLLPKANFVVIKLVPPISELDERCQIRFDKMLEIGAIEEVKKVLAQNLNRETPAMKTLGLPELLDYLEGKTSLEQASELGKLHSRQYAKRQRTWFNNKLNADIVLTSCYLGDKNIIEQVKNVLHNKS